MSWLRICTSEELQLGIFLAEEGTEKICIMGDSSLETGVLSWRGNDTQKIRRDREVASKQLVCSHPLYLR